MLHVSGPKDHTHFRCKLQDMTRVMCTHTPGSVQGEVKTVSIYGLEPESHIRELHFKGKVDT